MTSLHRPGNRAKEYDHGINITSVYWAVQNALQNERCGELPHPLVVKNWKKTLDRLDPPLPAVAEKHAIARQHVERWTAQIERRRP